MEASPIRPQSRDDIRIAIMCALKLEAEMVRSMFDIDWRLEVKHFDLRKVEGDDNTYSIGTIGKHNVVLVHLAGMGLVNSAAAATNLKYSYRKIEVIFVVGICGAAPTHPVTKDEVVLGDPIISTAVKQYDLSRRYPDCSVPKSDPDDVLGRAAARIRAWIQMLGIEENMKSLSSQLAVYLHSLNNVYSKTRYPGSKKDRLYESSHLHRHYPIGDRCEECILGSVICQKDCSSLGCGDTQLVPRLRFNGETDEDDAAHRPQVHFGIYGSSNTVLKSEPDRDQLTKVDGIAAYEMEGVGPWDTFPTVVIKSVCDYADSHKNKDFQAYAAATAAATLKSALEFWSLIDSSPQSVTNDISSLSIATSSIPSAYKASASSISQGSFPSGHPDGMTDDDLEEHLKELGDHVLQRGDTLLDFVKELRKNASLLRPGKGYWTYLTTEGHKAYEEIFDFIVQSNEDIAEAQGITLSQYFLLFGKSSPLPKTAISIWRRFRKGTQRPLRKCFFMAFLYMLHVEHYTRQYLEQKRPRTEADGSLGGDRLVMIRSFANWLSCPCAGNCGLQWNFAGPKWGILEDENRELASHCEMYRFYQEREAQRMFEPKTSAPSAYLRREQEKYSKLCKHCTNSWIALGKVQ